MRLVVMVQGLGGRRPESLDYLRRAANDLERVLQFSARDTDGTGTGEVQVGGLERDRGR